MRIFTLKNYTVVIILFLFISLSIFFFSAKRVFFLPGQTSNSHHLIESSCNSCHQPFKSVPDNNCNNCHEKDLAQDSHSEAKLLASKENKQLEFRKNCRDCHQEHTGKLRPITSKKEFCYSCHKTTIVEKENHRNFTVSSCWSSGCHNYHNNSELTLEVIKKQLSVDPSDLAFQVLPLVREETSTELNPNFPLNLSVNQEIISQWKLSYHSQISVNCMNCHQEVNNSFVKNPSQDICAKCHSFEFEAFRRSTHGIREKLKLTPLVQKQSKLAMKLKDDEHRKLSCFICHDVHTVNTRQASVESCLKCHNDEHSQKYLQSKHATLFAPEDKQRPGSQAVSCATCHMPRIEIMVENKNKVVVDHNNSFNLRPRDRMLKVCLACHDFEFSFNSIFDDEMVKNNFIGVPTKKHQTMKMLIPQTEIGD